jgi:hypothetical protein
MFVSDLIAFPFHPSLARENMAARLNSATGFVLTL